MTGMERIEVEWSGGTGMPGVSVFYGVVGVPGANADILTFFDSIKSLIPNVTTITVPSSGDVIEDTTGALVGSWSGGGGGSVAGGGTLDYAAGVGARVQWNTNGIRNGRRVRGATFLCPLTVNVFDTNGTLDPGSLTTLRNAATTLASAGTVLIWSRPSSPGGSDGESNAVLSATVPDRVTALRSRRY